MPCLGRVCTGGHYHGSARYPATKARRVQYRGGGVGWGGGGVTLVPMCYNYSTGIGLRDPYSDSKFV